jgi:hypothetical protein
MTAKPFEPIRRQPGTTDAAADFVRQLDKNARSTSKTIATLDKRSATAEQRIAELEAQVAALQAVDIFVPPVSELLLGLPVPDDSDWHYYPHTLGRPYKAAVIVGYLNHSYLVTVGRPQIVIDAGLDPADRIALRFEMGSSSAAHVNVWVW